MLPLPILKYSDHERKSVNTHARYLGMPRRVCLLILHYALTVVTRGIGATYMMEMPQVPYLRAWAIPW